MSTIYGMLSLGGNDINPLQPSFSPLLPPASPPETQSLPSPLDLEKDASGIGFFYEYEKRVVHGALTDDRNKLLADIRRKHFDLQERESRLRNSCHNQDVTSSCFTMSSDQFNMCCRLNREIGALLKTLENVESMMLRYDTSFYSSAVNTEKPEPHDLHSSYGTKTAGLYVPQYTKTAHSWPMV